MTLGEQKWNEQMGHDLCFRTIDKKAISSGELVQNGGRTEWSMALFVVWSGTMDTTGDH